MSEQLDHDDQILLMLQINLGLIIEDGCFSGLGVCGKFFCVEESGVSGNKFESGFKKDGNVELVYDTDERETEVLEERFSVKDEEVLWYDVKEEEKVLLKFETLVSKEFWIVDGGRDVLSNDVLIKFIEEGLNELSCSVLLIEFVVKFNGIVIGTWV